MIGQKDTDGVCKHCAVMESSSDGAKAREFEEQFVRANVLRAVGGLSLAKQPWYDGKHPGDRTPLTCKFTVNNELKNITLRYNTLHPEPTTL